MPSISGMTISSRTTSKAESSVGGAPDVQDPERLRCRARRDDVGVAGRQQRPFGQIPGVLGIVDHKYSHRCLRIHTEIAGIDTIDFDI